MRGLYWSDFWKLIRTNAAPNAILSLYGPNRLWPNKIDIYDRGMPRRRGKCGKEDVSELGYHEEDHWRDSHVTTASWLNAEIPLKSKAYYTNDGNTLDHEHSYKGAYDVLTSLIDNGCVLQTPDIKEELAKWERLSRPIQ